MFIPMPLPKTFLHHMLNEYVLQTDLGMGMGMNVTAHEGLTQADV